MRKIFVLFFAILLLLSACGGQKKPNIETSMSNKVPDFEYTSQDNEPFGLKDLEGKWWVADFVFTNCITACIPMTSNMSNLQDMMAEAGIEDVELVTFSVDPDYDTPEVLVEYAADYEADLSNWTFLTGYDFQTIKELSIKTFQNPLQEPIDDDQVIHGTRFFLVNPEGTVVKHYQGMMGTEMDIILDDLKEIAL